MITYPILKERRVIGITAPSSGVREELHPILRQAITRMNELGYEIVEGKTIWTQEKAKSAPAPIRANELNEMLQDENIDVIIPPWGGELLIEVIEHIHFESVKPKWVLGYSDTSLLLFVLTLKTGIATAHGTNLVDLRGEYMDDTTGMWQHVLETKSGEQVIQQSSEYYQKNWNFENPSPCVFHLNEKTEWKSITNENIELKGRLLGGCIDVIRHIVGTPYGDIAQFQRDHLHNEPLLWYFENCDLATPDLRRTLMQMRLAGWFNNCSGILFGRSSSNTPVNNYRAEDVYRDLSEELQVPIIYDIDCGHVPPQITFVNGAYGEVSLKDGKGKVVQRFI